MNHSRTLAAWLVHAFTASSAVFGLWAVYFITSDHLQIAFLFIIATIVIDSVDGPIARAVNVPTHTPNMDGSLLDNIIDFFTWVLVPCLLLIMHPLFNTGITFIITAGIAFAAAYQFCCLDAKISGQYFKRYPSAWSGCIVALYLVSWPKWLILCIIIVFIVYSFIPVYSPKAFTSARITHNDTLNRLLSYLNMINQTIIMIVIAVGSVFYPIKLTISSVLLACFFIISLVMSTCATHYKRTSIGNK